MSWLFVGLGTFVHFADRKITKLSDVTPCKLADRYKGLSELAPSFMQPAIGKTLMTNISCTFPTGRTSDLPLIMSP
jgi:hypothetical protein